MRILFLTHYFPPEVNAPASRTFEHCREWVRLGNEVTVVTCAPNHPTGKVYAGYQNRIWQSEVVAGIRVIRLWTYCTPNEGVVRRTLGHLSYMLAAIIATPLLPRADVVVSTSPQFFCGLAGRFVSRLKRARWVLEIRDLWPESIVAVEAVKQKALIRLLEHVETWAYRKADRIVALTHAFARHIEARDISPEKIAVIKNGVDLAFYSLPRETVDLRDELGLQGKFVAAYFGTLGMAHGLRTILQSAELLKHDPKIAFLIAGGGADRSRLLQLWREKQLANVVILDQQPKERMPALWATSDASLVLLRKSPLFTTVIPSKLFEAMAMARPIILGVDGESRQILEEAGCGIPIQPEDAEALAAAVARLARDQAAARAMGESGRRWVSEHHDRNKLAVTFATLMQGLVSKPRASAAPGSQ